MGLQRQFAQHKSPAKASPGPAQVGTLSIFCSIMCIYVSVAHAQVEVGQRLPASMSRALYSVPESEAIPADLAQAWQSHSLEAKSGSEAATLNRALPNTADSIRGVSGEQFARVLADRSIQQWWRSEEVQNSYLGSRLNRIEESLRFEVNLRSGQSQTTLSSSDDGVTASSAGKSPRERGLASATTRAIGGGLSANNEKMREHKLAVQFLPVQSQARLEYKGYGNASLVYRALSSEVALEVKENLAANQDVVLAHSINGADQVSSVAYVVRW